MELLHWGQGTDLPALLRTHQLTQRPAAGRVFFQSPGKVVSHSFECKWPRLSSRVLGPCLAEGTYFLPQSSVLWF